MAGTDTAVVRLSDLAHGQEATCFAALIKKDRGVDKHGNPFMKCHFRDKRSTAVAPLWSDNALRIQAEAWADGIAYRLRVRGDWKVKYGLQLDIIEIRPATDDDAADGYDFYDLVESTDYDPETLLASIHDKIERCIDDPYLKRLVEEILSEHGDLFKKMPAAQSFHHSYTAGLLEHVWSMTRVASFLADHYGNYYEQLNPPLNKGLIVASTILHDIGKLRELEYHPVETKYTKEGCLIGHVLMGRDLVRETARKIEGFPEETLLLLEHAILAHHGKRDFGAPIVPQTLEALLVSYVDDLDAKMNIAARQRLNSTNEGEFTDKVYALDNRRLYKGIPREAPVDHDLNELA
ncbi:3'-5' exoribonuclease YhaM family protein [Singulisphaera acidiphila]|uniref:Putative HD superfamily hydrolase n=1 Tax=Singulisphaera acidiphila (strain ATCC BAA-1392 / DSM 18658 / VKM B-2454 / MOB10) TaxID=886293 RepID=L0DJP4_SINAD|nr:HD domain-containing protein [Singulisphaera acidiphila]AGA29053.1 putative HD superfamily hydrolase [Singulisphaera acidiphila DSM 18658]